MLAVVALFLAAMAALGMFGRLRIGRRTGKGRRARARRCPGCGRHRVGSGPCECGRA